MEKEAGCFKRCKREAAEFGRGVWSNHQGVRGEKLIKGVLMLHCSTSVRWCVRSSRTREGGTFLL